MRFEVAFTFTRSSRPFVRRVAECVAAELSTSRVLFDEYHDEELSTPRGGLSLLEWYERDSRLVVVVLSAGYAQPDNWTFFEWPQVLSLIRKRQRSQSVFLLRTDDTEPSSINGLSDMAFAFDTRERTPQEVADAIRSRLRRLEIDETGAVAIDHRQTSSRFLVPAELPPDVLGFAGRSRELEKLRALASTGTTLVVYGLAGVGKSAFVTHAAHSLADVYPDGQLYINLQGSTPGVEPVEPVDALSRCLRALGMNGDDVPHDLDEAAARFRSLVAGRRLLVVMDNASSADQVRPLITVGNSSTFITSRTLLASLDGARRLNLDVLAEDEALNLLAWWIGKERMDAEPGETENLTRLCDYLPLALRIIGARLAARPRWPLKAVVARLADEQNRLSELEVGDVEIRSSFQVSYASLRSKDHADVFKLLGLLDAPVLSTEAVAALATVSTDSARDVLEALVDDQLLESISFDQYRIHDLVRLFAREHAIADCSIERQEEAVSRVLEFFIGTAEAASSLIQPADPRRRFIPRQEAHPLTTRNEAIQWMESERANLLAVLRRAAADSGRHDAILARAADAIFWFCHLRSYPRDLAVVSTLAGEAAERIGDRNAQAQSLHNLCIAYLRLHDHAKALHAGECSLALRRDLNDTYGECRTIDALGRIFRASGDPHKAVEYGLGSLRLARHLGDRYSESNVLCNLVDAYLDAGLSTKAIECGEESVVVRSKLGDEHGVARMRMSLGTAYEANRRFPEAIDAWDRSLPTFEQLGDRYSHARCLYRLGVAHLTNGNATTAEDYLRRTLTACREMGDTLGETRAQAVLARIMEGGSLVS